MHQDRFSQAAQHQGQTHAASPRRCRSQPEQPQTHCSHAREALRCSVELPQLWHGWGTLWEVDESLLKTPTRQAGSAGR